MRLSLFSSKQCIIKQVLDSVFVISGKIKVSVSVISLSLRLRLITPTSTLIIPDITKTSSNNCLLSAWLSHVIGPTKWHGGEQVTSPKQGPRSSSRKRRNELSVVDKRLWWRLLGAQWRMRQQSSLRRKGEMVIKNKFISTNREPVFSSSQIFLGHNILASHNTFFGPLDSTV